jgi:hypothetical protein
LGKIVDTRPPHLQSAVVYFEFVTGRPGMGGIQALDYAISGYMQLYKKQRYPDMTANGIAVI